MKKKKKKKEANPWVDCRFSIFPIFCALFCFQSELKILLITPDVLKWSQNGSKKTKFSWGFFPNSNAFTASTPNPSQPPSTPRPPSHTHTHTHTQTPKLFAKLRLRSFA